MWGAALKMSSMIFLIMAIITWIVRDSLNWTFPSYWLNRKWAWGKHGRSHFMKEVVPFWTMAALGIAFSIVGAAVARHIGREHDLSHLELTLVVEAANVISFAIFWVAKLMVFNKMFKVELAEFDEHLAAEEAVEETATH